MAEKSDLDLWLKILRFQRLGAPNRRHCKRAWLANGPRQKACNRRILELKV